ncbi:MAG: hypothetical protein ACJ71Q_21950 [Terriglobales bacterium]
MDVLKRRTVSQGRRKPQNEARGDENRPEASIWLSIASVFQLLCMEFRAFSSHQHDLDAEELLWDTEIASPGELEENLNRKI